LLTIDGYARIDLRLTADNKIYFIEANPNPHLAADEDFAQSAQKAGLKYPQLINAIIRLGMSMARGLTPSSPRDESVLRRTGLAVKQSPRAGCFAITGPPNRAIRISRG